MNSFDFFEFFGSQTVFIGGWGTNFIFFRIFWTSNDKKTVKFVFK
jgi:hypothetical protein